MPINVIMEIVTKMAINWSTFSKSKKKIGMSKLTKIAITGVIPPKVGIFDDEDPALCTSLLVYPFLINNLSI
jgi:hypothetical protein